MGCDRGGQCVRQREWSIGVCGPGGSGGSRRGGGRSGAGRGLGDTDSLESSGSEGGSVF